jgi:aminoglycoside 3-N-acetyltransferase
MTEREGEERIARELAVVGLRRGAVALVHSSLGSMGHVPGGAETVVSGLLRALGPEGTLLMPALSYEHCNASRPVFDVLRTPSNVGAIPEYFRLRRAALRSVCPTHSVCGLGPRADGLLREHHLDDTPCGEHSPYRRMRGDGQIVFLGCGLRPNTSMHSVEEVAEAPYLFGSVIAYRVILADGSETRLRRRRHGFAGWSQRYDRLGPLLGREGLRVGRVLQAQAHLVECPVMWERALAAMARDPFHFVERRRPT